MIEEVCKIDVFVKVEVIDKKAIKNEKEFMFPEDYERTYTDKKNDKLELTDLDEESFVEIKYQELNASLTFDDHRFLFDRPGLKKEGSIPLSLLDACIKNHGMCIYHAGMTSYHGITNYAPTKIWIFS